MFSVAFISAANCGSQGASGNSVPVNLTRPSISSAGTNVGDTQTLTPGTYTNSPTSYTRAWLRDGVAILGATGLTYDLTSDDQGHGIAATETPINAAGSGATQRATTGNPRQFFISGDSLWSHTEITDDLQTALGADWEVTNTATSGDHISPGSDANSMEAKAQTRIDPSIQKGWGINFFHEYANQVDGIQGASTGAETFDLLEAFGQARQAAGAITITSTCYYRPASEHPGNTATGHAARDGTEAHVASELTRSGYATHAAGFIDLDVNSYLVSADQGAIGDGVHWAIATDNTLRASVIALIVAKIAELGLVGDGGEIAIPNVLTRNHLCTYSGNAHYIYDPVNPLDLQLAALPAGLHYIHFTGGSGWTIGSSQLLEPGFIFGSTQDGTQYVIGTNTDQPTAGLSGGVYTIDSTP